MKIAYSLQQARANALQQGIQQTNRYSMVYGRLAGLLLYPYSIVLPGYGYDLIDHSIWSIIRKIPFRKTYTDLQVSFMVGNKNYTGFVSTWNSILTRPKSGNKTVDSTWAYNNQVPGSASESGTWSYENALETTATYTTFGGIDFNGAMNNLISDNDKNTINGNGGAVNYMDKIYPDKVIVNLLDEESAVRSTFVFNEAYISQIAPVQLTSTETGYSTFTVNFRFASVDVR
jgi:hypothetical protein